MPKHAIWTGILSVFIPITIAYPQLSVAAEAPLFSVIANGNTAKTSSVDAAAKSAAGVWSIRFEQSLRTLDVGDVFSFPLPDKTSISVTVESQRSAPGGNTVLVGSFESNGRLILTLGRQATFASLMGQGINYSISFEAGQPILINQSTVENEAIDLGHDIRVPINRKLEGPQLTLDSMRKLGAIEQQKTDVSIVDLLVVYPPEFADRFSDPVARINQLVAFSNDAFARSQILIELRLVKAEQLNFNNSANIGTNLDAATAGTGAFSGLRQLRDDVGADLVAVLQAGSSGASGVAWVNGDSAYYAVSSTRISPRCCDAVFTHEIGHNLGSGHEHLAANPRQSSPCGFNFTGYSCGHGNASQGWGTIMSYLNDRAVGYRFSNLDSDCQGQPCGIPEGQPNAADNRRSFNLSRVLVEAFRPTVVPLEPDPPNDPDPDPPADPDPDPPVDPDPDPEPPSDPDPVPDPDPNQPGDPIGPARKGWLIPILDLLLAEDHSA